MWGQLQQASREAQRDFDTDPLTGVPIGYQVLVAASGEDCLRLLEAHEDPVRLPLADVIMPGMNGRELYRRALAQRPDLRVLFMSGYTEDVIAPQGVPEKDVDFIRKPFSAQSLTRKLREILDR